MTRSATTFFVDTSCIIAAVCGWHKHHREAAAEIERRLAGLSPGDRERTELQAAIQAEVQAAGTPDATTASYSLAS